ncbi:CLUMA_CG015799, isoform A [Clunio marinus]|uniref:CLUMA_CG015799, isoform A n=1 Tax=Clunio marinus TaxID=568069 RepID=A0A1J1ISD0_9DIPT|nr:CLUMA_CG015799, isoform A [Clunio marinus]
MKKIVILGGGVNGLSSAVKIAEHFHRQDVQVTLISEDVSPNTTGDVSAGYWTPFLVEGTSDEKITKWSKSSYDFFHQLWLNGLAEECGISMIPTYRLTSDPEGEEAPLWKDVVFGFTKLNSDETARLSREHNQTYTEGFHYITFCCEPTKFLPYLMKRFLAAGGRFIKQKINNIDEVSEFDLIVNCTGLGSKEVTNDMKCFAIRGQVARIKAPWIYCIFNHTDDDGNYIIPNTNDVILGGTHQVNDYSLEISKADSAFIFNGCKKIIPSIENAEVIKEMVGLRPGRKEIRLETELRRRNAPIIHNVGHGGSGVTLCWGCSDDVLQLTIELFKKAKL